MNYESFISDIPNDTRNTIFKAIDIYKILKNMKIEVLGYKESYYANRSKKTLTKNDKKCLSLLLSSLLLNSKLKLLLNNYGLTAKHLIDYLEININDISESTILEYRKCFVDDFELLITNIKNYSSYKINSNKDFIAEYLIVSLGNNEICNSSSVSWFYESAEIFNNLPSFMQLTYEITDKLISEKRISRSLRNDEINDLFLEMIPKMSNLLHVEYKFTNKETELLIGYVKRVTSKNHRVSNEKISNVDLAFIIIKLAFALAVVEGSNCIDVNHMITSVMISDKITEEAKSRYSNILLNDIASLDNKEECLIIEFPKNLH